MYIYTHVLCNIPLVKLLDIHSMSEQQDLHPSGRLFQRRTSYFSHLQTGGLHLDAERSCSSLTNLTTDPPTRETRVRQSRTSWQTAAPRRRECDVIDGNFITEGTLAHRMPISQ